MNRRIATHALVACVWGSVVASLIGCGSGGGADLKLNPEQARQALTTFLETWSKGEPVTALASQKPAIVGRDPSWEGGDKLARFKVGEEKSDGANLHVDVELELESADKGKVTQKVTYVVGTSPVITVFRNE
ncbi:MAG: hypothetical protein U0935_15140 [Pirellulales bacterium]